MVLVGETRGPLVSRLRELGWGRMWLYRDPAPFEGEPWGFDNGAFGAWLHGRSFPEDDFLRRLDAAYRIGRPLVAVAPDIVAGGVRSLEFSLIWRDRLPDDWPWYLAVQDGIGASRVEPYLHRFAGIFLGGTTSFKGTAHLWCRFAHEHGLRFHYGRAGTPRRLIHAMEVGADSLDSSFPLWTRERFERFAHVWQEGGDGQVRLPIETAIALADCLARGDAYAAQVREEPARGPGSV
jgi:hypothetical protein